MVYNKINVKWGDGMSISRKNKNKIRVIALLLLIFFIANICLLILPAINVRAEENIKTYVSVTIDGDNIQFDALPFIVGQRTIVPIRALMESLGAEVAWNPEMRMVTIKSGETTMRLTVNDTKAFLNDKEVILDVPAQIRNNRVFVPLRFVSENMNLKVEWNGTTKTVILTSKTISKEENNFLNAEISGDEAVFSFKNNNISYTKIFLRSPDRLVIDIKDCVNSLESYNMPDNVYIEAFRYSQYTINPNYVRLVLQLRGDTKYQIVASGRKIKVVFGEKANEVVPDNTLPKDPGAIKIVIDPGHGGSDPGACGYASDGTLVLKEKVPNLTISLKLCELLKSAGFNVTMTRSSDVFVGLSERAQIANNIGADLFVSIHNNANDNLNASGTMVMYAYDNPKDNMSISGKQFAQTVQKHLVEALPGTNDYGAVKNSSLAVVKRTLMPAIIVESLFVSNESDRKKLMDKDVLNNIATAVYNGILDVLD